MVKEVHMTRATTRILLPVLAHSIALINVSIPYPQTENKRGDCSPLPRLLVRRFELFFTDCVKLNCAPFDDLLTPRFKCFEEARDNLRLCP